MEQSPPVLKKLKIKQILQKKTEKVYDLTVPNNHNFILDNGLIAHNCSHASAYSMITYACMFLKHYYPMEWWAAVLTNADEGEISTALFKHVRDKVIPPDINFPSNEMVIDYEKGKIRAKMTVMKGLGETVSTPIIQNAPYANIKDFIRKKVAGPSLALRLIHVGIMDSLFPKDATLLEKIQTYEDAVLEVAYEEKIAAGKKAKPPQKGKVDPYYLSMNPMQDFIAKKMILPTLPMSLSDLVVKYSPILNEGTSDKPFFSNSKGKASAMLTGDQFYELEKRAASTFDRDMYFCVPAYIIDTKEFNFSKNTKKALKMTVDIDGRISERVMWPEWGTDIVKYPKDFKKHTIAILFMTLKAGRTEARVSDIKVLA